MKEAPILLLQTKQVNCLCVVDSWNHWFAAQSKAKFYGFVGEVVGDLFEEEPDQHNNVVEVAKNDVLQLEGAILYWKYNNLKRRLFPPTKPENILRCTSLIFSSKKIISKKSLSVKKDENGTNFPVD